MDMKTLLDTMKESTNQKVKNLHTCLNLMNDRFKNLIIEYHKHNLEVIIIRSTIKMQLANMMKEVMKQISEIEKQKGEGTYVSKAEREAKARQEQLEELKKQQ